MTSRREPSPAFVDDVTPSRPPAQVEGDRLRVTLVNHSTVLLQVDGINILTDPVWSERVSPISWAGPRRHRAPGVRWEDLPRIDLVLLSHNHYDHLDAATLRRLSARGSAEFVVPLGLAPLVRSLGATAPRQMDWGDHQRFRGITIHGVPAYHFSGRSPFDRDRTLWCGYLLETAAGSIYFAADTGFGDLFEQIRARFGAPRLALLPIGAYEPRWFMAPVHMGPDEALRAHRILGAQTSVAIHHGTFQLADESIDTAPRVLRQSGADESFVVLNNGEFITLTR